MKYSAKTVEGRHEIYKRMLQDWEPPFVFDEDWRESQREERGYTLTSLRECEENNNTNCGLCDYLHSNYETFNNVSYRELPELNEQGSEGFCHFGYDITDPQSQDGYLWGTSDKGRANRVEALRIAIEKTKV